ncbi:MAG TPA: hypothetical protein VFE50_08040 [Cyclobacteriaceae bacterium]|nr:hypothetical protein [Cyclobacteriaceae bacterium]
MKGGGFLKQSADSFKYNRSLIGIKEPGERERKRSHLKKTEFHNDKKMSDALRDDILKDNQAFIGQK